jgi:hypothetical protein
MQGLTHWPAWHEKPAWHTLPQPPQLSGSLCSSTHELPHWVVMALQTWPQVVPSHSWAEVQATPHAPQFRGSVFGTQAPLQRF